MASLQRLENIYIWRLSLVDLMKRGIILLFLVLSIYLASVSAYSVNIDSSSNQEIILSFSGFNEVVPIQEIVATAETATLSDTYPVSTKLNLERNNIVVSIDIHEIFEDYTLAEVEYVTISGLVDGEPFAKRITMREGRAVKFAAPAESFGTPNYLYGLLMLAILFVIVIIVFVLLAPQASHRRKKSGKKTKKKVTRKKKTKKKVSKKKVKKKKTKKRK